MALIVSTLRVHRKMLNCQHAYRPAHQFKGIIATMEDTTCYIYALIDPRDNRIRYIGKTNNPIRRLREHCQFQYETNRRANWLNLLRSLHIKPIIKVIEECNESNWTEKEVYYKNYYESLGFDLTNSDEGGLGRSAGFHMSPESKNKISRANKGRKHSEEYKHKQREKMKGNSFRLGIPHADETRKKMSYARKGRVLTTEHRKRLSLALSGKNNPMYGKRHTGEWKKNKRKQQLGKKHTEETKQKIREANRGDRTSWSKLTEAQVSDIKFLLKAGCAVNKIAKLYSVNRATISNIKSEKSWSHVKI